MNLINVWVLWIFYASFLGQTFSSFIATFLIFDIFISYYKIKIWFCFSKRNYLLFQTIFKSQYLYLSYWYILRKWLFRWFFVSYFTVIIFKSSGKNIKLHDSHKLRLNCIKMVSMFLMLFCYKMIYKMFPKFLKMWNFS